MAVHRQTHRLSTCHRYPTKPITGFCAPCLSECLADLDSAAAHPQSPTWNPHSGSDLQRSKSCSDQRPESSSANAPDPTRHKSCDVLAQNTLSELFNINDDRKGLPRKFEVKLRGEEQRDDNGDEARVLDSDAEFKTMKELINLEWERKKGAGRDLKEITGTFWGTASRREKLHAQDCCGQIRGLFEGKGEHSGFAGHRQWQQYTHELSAMSSIGGNDGNGEYVRDLDGAVHGFLM
ncbi:hypothetical protein ACE6H2_022569 [Prunus campanulata]